MEVQLKKMKKNIKNELYNFSEIIDIGDKYIINKQ
jgi:hypothetical protein